MRYSLLRHQILFCKMALLLPSLIAFYNQVYLPVYLSICVSIYVYKYIYVAIYIYRHKELTYMHVYAFVSIAVYAFISVSSFMSLKD